MSDQLLDDIQARLTAIEATLKNLYSLRIHDEAAKQGVEPHELALTAQGNNMMSLKRQIDNAPDDEIKKHWQQSATHMTRLMEELVQQFEVK